MAAEADTPRRSSSGVTYDQAPAAVPVKFLPVEVLANAMHEVKTASDQSEALVQMVIQIDEASKLKQREYFLMANQAPMLCVSTGLGLKAQAISLL